MTQFKMRKGLGHVFGRALAALWGLAVSVPGMADAQPAFYMVSEQELAGRAGTVIRQEPIGGAPLGASAYRVLYRSTGLHGEPIAVSGVVIVPAHRPPVGARPIVAWAHPTTGVVPRCAPSQAFFFFQSIQGLREMIERGYVVVATDYPGLGTPGPHPYLVGVSAARAVLDSVRVARLMPDTGGGQRFIVWGHSQGGHAALFTGLLANDYAPNLNLLGIAAAAPATDLAALLVDDFETAGGKSLMAMALWSWARVFGAPIDRVVDPTAMAAVDQLADECIESIFDLIVRRRSERPLERAFLTVKNLAEVEPWRSLLVRNTPGPLPHNIPIFLSQGTADKLVAPQVTYSYARALCKAGSAIRMLVMPDVNHGFIARDSARAAVDWMADRFGDRAVPNDCSKVMTGAL
jgi:acetyl esterase/lipase